MILDGDLRPLAPRSAGPATNTCCVYTVTELTNKNEKTCYTHTHTAVTFTDTRYTHPYTHNILQQ